MNYFAQGLILIFFILCSGLILAADIPQDDEGANTLDQVQCVSDNNNNCINAVCLTSDDIDCQEKCQQLAQEKCQQQNAE